MARAWRPWQSQVCLPTWNLEAAAKDSNSPSCKKAAPKTARKFVHVITRHQLVAAPKSRLDLQTAPKLSASIVPLAASASALYDAFRKTLEKQLLREGES